MKTTTICLTFAFGLASSAAPAQGSRRCDGEAPRLLAAGARRTAGLPGQTLPRHLAAAGRWHHRHQRPAPAADNWIVSETTSPLDYTPVAIATASSRGGPDGAIMQLSIQCRGGRTELVIGDPPLRAASRTMSSPTSSITTSRWWSRPARRRRGPASPSEAMSCGCWRRCPTEVRSLSRHSPAGRCAGRAVRPGRPENRAGPAGRPLQMAGRHRRAAQLTIPEQQYYRRA